VVVAEREEEEGVTRPSPVVRRRADVSLLVDAELMSDTLDAALALDSVRARAAGGWKVVREVEEVGVGET
jgi:hypothetical protein